MIADDWNREIGVEIRVTILPELDRKKNGASQQGDS